VNIGGIDGYVITGGSVVVDVYMDTQTYFTITLSEDSVNGIIFWSADNWATEKELKGTERFLEGTDLKLKAVGADDWEFSAWTGDGDISSVNGRSITMDKDFVIGASFVQNGVGPGDDPDDPGTGPGGSSEDSGSGMIMVVSVAVVAAVLVLLIVLMVMRRH
jgi:hypothetical protein